MVVVSSTDVIFGPLCDVNFNGCNALKFADHLSLIHIRAARCLILRSVRTKKIIYDLIWFLLEMIMDKRLRE